ncbi:MAG: ankyrin repeat domain-containing protein [Planctomycetota bacterium]
MDAKYFWFSAVNRVEYIQEVKKLIEKGADINAKIDGFSALHIAVQKGDKDMVELLLNKGAGVNSKTMDGVTPLDAAVEKGQKDIADLLCQHGAKSGKELDKKDK